jgi:coenzyme F420-0:L-glutamate ligase / coenzyme F420-1:gamma-L-glutamate ligase
MSRVILWAVPGIGEVAPGTDVGALVADALDRDPHGPLVTGDILVITSKIISKAEGRLVQAEDREGAIDAETMATVARRGSLRVVRTRAGFVLAAAGVDTSNVPSHQVALLPRDADASAEALRRALRARTGADVGVLISDTAGRAWRVGQTDHTIGAAGVRLIERYAGRVDAYGNTLQVTERALADEIAGAADLVKGKLSGCPVAVVRGLGSLVSDADEPARALVRPLEQDLFRLGTRESVLWATLEALEQGDRFEELAGSPPERVVAALENVLSEQGVPPAFVSRLLSSVTPDAAP